MKLPANCPHADKPSVKVDRQKVDCCRIHDWMLGTEEPLCRAWPEDSEVYRFFWHSSFHGDAVVSVHRNAGAITLRWKYAHPRRTAADDAPPVVVLLEADWQLLQDCLEAATFWSLRHDDVVPRGFDGAEWLIEGRRNDDYQAVSRWSPDWPLEDLGRLFFALAGPPLARVKLY